MAAVLKPRKEFEDILGSHGTSFKVPERPYSVLADDMRLNPDYTFSLEEAKEIQAEAIHRRAFWDSVRMAASAQGVPLHEMAVARGLHVRPEKEPIVGNHNELYRREQNAREADGHRRDEQIMANIEASQRQMEDALRAPKSLTDQIAEAAKEVAGRAGGAAGGFLAGGIGHDAGQVLAGQAAKGGLYAADAAGQAATGVVAGTGKAALYLGAKALGFEIIDAQGREL